MMDAVAIRLNEVERRLSVIESSKPEVIAEQVRNLREDLVDMRADFRSMRRAMLGLALTIAGGSAVFAFTAFTLWGA